MITGGYFSISDTLPALNNTLFFSFFLPPGALFYRVTLPNKKLLVEEEGGQCNVFLLLPTTPVGSVAQPQESARACSPSRQQLGSPLAVALHKTGSPLSQARGFQDANSIFLYLTNPNQKEKKEKKRARTHIHGGELLNFGIMPAIDGQRLVNFEDDERESEYGYVRKVGMQCVFCVCAFASYIFSSVSNTRWKIGH
jgi:hypothetical protein